VLRASLLLGLLSLVVLLSALSSPTPGGAIFHLALIDEVMSGVGGDPDAQYIEVRMEAPGQHIVHDTLLSVFDEDSNPALTLLLILPDDVPNSGTNLHWIMATQAFAELPQVQQAGFTPDVIFPPGILAPKGMVCWGAPEWAPPPDEWPLDDELTEEEEGYNFPFLYTDCVSYGGYGSPPFPPTCSGLAVVGKDDANNGFARWYQDCGNLVLRPCLDQTFLCLTNEPDSGSPISFPDNFPTESYWWRAAASMPTGAGSAQVTMALKGAFSGDGQAVDGNQLSVNLIHIQIDGLTPGEQYTVTHPYGVEVLTANAQGEAEFLDEIGCQIPPCDFSLALGGTVGPFLMWDPAQSPLPPTDFIGDPTVSHSVIGSPFDTNFFRVEGADAGGPGVGLIETAQFSVMGKRFNPPPPIHPPATSLPLGDGTMALQRIAPPPVETIEISPLHLDTPPDAEAFELRCPTPQNNAGQVVLLGADDDADGLPNCHEAELGTNPAVVDTDQDGCADGEEAGTSPTLGGQRDPTNFWDFFDVPAGTSPQRDKMVNIIDIAAVILRFGTVSDPPLTKEDAFAQALTVPPDLRSYHAAFDRDSPIPGEDLWDLLPPDGAINIIDIAATVIQFGHTCSAPP
jgi:hypothetical protein